MSLDSTTGVISGTPQNPTTARAYTITATNPAGETTVRLLMTVRTNRAKSLVAYPNALSDAQRRHFLTRTHFGVEADDLADLEEMGLEAFIDQMLVFETDTQAEQDAFNAWIVDEARDPEGQFPSRTDVARWWTDIIINTDNPFQESLAVFWHDHFAASSDVLGSGSIHWVLDYVNIFRDQGNGNLRDTLVQVARDNLMLRYLDGYRSTRYAPNENFAREFWELFTLGVDNGYTQDDIVEAARAFTGYQFRLNADTGLYYMEFNPARKDPTNKVIFGQTIVGQTETDDYQAMVDITLQEKPVAEFICKKLWEWYVYPDAPDVVVDELASIMRTNDYDMSEVLKAMFMSEAFYSSAAERSLVKNPLDFSVGFTRSTGLHLYASTLDGQLNQMGLRVTSPPTVDGWPAGPLWLSSQAMLERTNVANLAVEYTNQQRGRGMEVADILPAVEDRTAENVVDTLLDLLWIDYTAEERTAFIAYLNTLQDNEGNTIDSPFDGSNQTHLDDRVRGLLWILSQHPSYHLR
jgi:uncharacterized protein (DUF1800 family)